MYLLQVRSIGKRGKLILLLANTKHIQNIDYELKNTEKLHFYQNQFIYGVH